MNDQEWAVVFEYVGRDVVNMMSVFDAEGTAEEKEEVLQFGAGCAIDKLVDAGLVKSDLRDEVAVGFAEFIKMLHKGDK